MRAAKVDANQPEIAEQAQKLGFSYQSLATLGKGTPDAIFGYDGINLFVEIKDGKNDLNDMQIDYHGKWNGQICTIWNVYDLVIEFIRVSYKMRGKVGLSSLQLMMSYMEMGNERSKNI